MASESAGRAWEKSQKPAKSPKIPAARASSQGHGSRESDLSPAEITRIQTDYDELVAEAKISQQKFMTRMHGAAPHDMRPSDLVTQTIKSEDWPRLVAQGMTLMRPGDGPDRLHSRRLEVVSQLANAERGRHSMKPNKSSKEYARTKAVLDVHKTSAGFAKYIRSQRQQSAVRILKPGHMSNRVGYMRTASAYMSTVENVDPFRLVWNYLESTKDLHVEEERMRNLAQFFRWKHPGAGVAAQAMSHYRQFHKTVLGVRVPEFQLLANDLRLFAHEDSHAPQRLRKVQAAIQPIHVFQLGKSSETEVFDPPSGWHMSTNQKLEELVFWVVSTMAFAHHYRIESLMRGKTYDPRLHFSVKWLRPIETLLNGQDTTLTQCEVKTPTEVARLPILVYLEDKNPQCWAYAYQTLRQFDPIDDEDEDVSAFRIDSSGNPPDYEWFMSMLKDRTSKAGMSESIKLDGRCFRRGASNAMDALRVPEPLQEKLGTWVPGSKARKRYKTPIRHDARSVQRRLLQMPRYSILTDDVGFLKEPLSASAGIYRDDTEVVHSKPTASSVDTTQWGLSSVAEEPLERPAPPSGGRQDTEASLMPPPSQQRQLRLKNGQLGLGRPQAPPSVNASSTTQPSPGAPTASAQNQPTETATASRGNTGIRGPPGPVQILPANHALQGFVVGPQPPGAKSLCLEWQFNWNHDFWRCPHKQGHRCHFCGVHGGYGHSGLDCTKGGASAVREFAESHHVLLNTPKNGKK